MKGKWIWIIVAALAIVLIVLLLRSKGSSDTRTASASGTNGGSTTQFLQNLAEQTQDPPSSSDCRSDCRLLCKPLPADKLFGCGTRCQCKRDCRSACAGGEDYKNMFP